MLIPVILPPGRFRLATRPSATGSPPTANTIVWPGATFPQPLTGLVVHYANGHWLDFYGNNYDAWVTISLPDNDVFAIDATATGTGTTPHGG